MQTMKTTVDHLPVSLIERPSTSHDAIDSHQQAGSVGTMEAKAIGAKRRTILLQFLIEAAAICLIGGAIGLGIAWPITLVMSYCDDRSADVRSAPDGRPAPDG